MKPVHEELKDVFYNIDQRDELHKIHHFEQINKELMESIESFYDEFREIRFEIPNLFSFPPRK